MESVETENKNKQRIKTNQCAPGWARNSVENRRNPVFLSYNKVMLSEEEVKKNLVGSNITTYCIAAFAEVMFAGMAIMLIMFFYIRHYTHFTYEEMGLKIKGIGKAVKTDCLFTVIFAAALFGVKFILMRTSPGFFPAGAPFWDWGRLNWSDIAYPVTVVLQEFLSRGVIHENLRRIFVGKHSEGAAIIVSSLIFGALHIHRGFMYMLAATALLSIFGILYRRQNSIWGLCIPHFVLGEIVWYLGFV